MLHIFAVIVYLLNNSVHRLKTALRKVYDIVFKKHGKPTIAFSRKDRGERSLLFLFDLRLQNEAERQRNRRAAMKQNINKVCQEN